MESEKAAEALIQPPALLSGMLKAGQQRMRTDSPAGFITAHPKG